ncbi:RrF2 family transcriptional regulator [Seleniivibrio woodruffii]|uniref:RrF2 family transcriptional regulator n=1 Tax=Seleniivibrio woodruffii TaxID=1078050 RepID=UPI0024094D71|nr:Rrf2 family transcriptional regulator [Seleniivibrio woodruffii]
MDSFILREEDYAIRIIVFLATVGRQVKTDEICKSLYLSRPIVVKIINKLKSGGFIVTKTGKDGGLTISESTPEASMFDILSCMGFTGKVNACTSDHAACQLLPICKINRLFGDIQREIEERLKRAKIKEFLFNGNELFTKSNSMQEV